MHENVYSIFTMHDHAWNMHCPCMELKLFQKRSEISANNFFEGFAYHVNKKNMFEKS